MPGRIGLSLSRGQLPPSPPCAARTRPGPGLRTLGTCKARTGDSERFGGGGAGFRGRMRPNRPARMAYTAISRGRSTRGTPGNRAPKRLSDLSVVLAAVGGALLPDPPPSSSRPARSAVEQSEQARSAAEEPEPVQVSDVTFDDVNEKFGVQSDWTDLQGAELVDGIGPLLGPGARTGRRQWLRAAGRPAALSAVWRVRGGRRHRRTAVLPIQPRLAGPHRPRSAASACRRASTCARSP